MPDTMTPTERSALMARIRGKDTKPEMIVRRTAHRLGYRFRLHRRDLPGSPDLIFPSRRKAIFVHGCFWHGHDGCKRAATPKTHASYWALKIQRNKRRDQRATDNLESLGWASLVIWECQTRDHVLLAAAISNFLGLRSGGHAS